MATAEPKYSAAEFRRLLAERVDLYRSCSDPQSSEATTKAEASAKNEAQIKEIVELVSPGFGNPFIDLFRKAWSSPEDAKEYVWRQNLIVTALLDFAAVKRKPHVEKARQQKVDQKVHRNKKMVDEYLRIKPSWDDSATKLMADIGRRQDPPLSRSAAVAVINRELQDRGFKPAKRQKA